MATARSLAAAAKAATRGESVARLCLAESTDLQCRNIMCEKLEQACVCRLARFVAQTPLRELRELDITSNSIDTLPTAVFEHLPALETLAVARNKLREIPSEIAHLQHLRVLDVRENPINAMPLEALAGLPSLECLYVQGLDPEIITALRSALAGRNCEIIDAEAP